MAFNELFLICLTVLAAAGFLMRRTLLRGITLAALAAACAAALFTQAALWLCLVCFAGAWLVLALMALAFLFLICARVDVTQPQEHDSKFYRSVMYVYIEALISLVGIRLHTTGLEKTPKEGRFLLVCNHLFLADPGVLLHCFKKSQLAFISKQENIGMPIVGKFLHKIMCQTLDRDNDRQALKTILKCIQLLKEDEVSVGVFPEGYTSKDNKLHHFRAGVFKIAQKAGVPIVVCTIQGTREIFRNLKKMKRTDVTLHLVDVIPAEELKGKTTVEISDRVYELMLNDLGEDFRPEEG